MFKFDKEGLAKNSNIAKKKKNRKFKYKNFQNVKKY